MSIFLKTTMYLLAICFIAFLSFGVKAETSSNNYSITQSVEDSTGLEESSANYNIKNEIGGVVSGKSASNNYIIQHGIYWFFNTGASANASEEDNSTNNSNGAVPIYLLTSTSSDQNAGLQNIDLTGDNNVENNENENNSETEEQNIVENTNDENPETEIKEDAISGNIAGDQEYTSEEKLDNNLDSDQNDTNKTNQNESKGDGRVGNLEHKNNISNSDAAVQNVKRNILKIYTSVQECLKNNSCYDYFKVNQIFESISRYTKNLTQSDLLRTTNKNIIGIFSILNLAYIGSQLNSISQIPYIFLNLLGFFAFRNRRQKEGRVYDVKTGQPIPFARIAVYDENGHMRETKVSDKMGTYFFLVPKGKYFLNVQKKGYDLISSKNNIANARIIYNSLYVRKKELDFDQDGIIAENIPLIAKSKKNKEFILIFKRFIDIFLDLLFYTGFIASILISITDLSYYNIFISFIYLFLYLLKIVNIARPKWGTVYSDRGESQAFSFVKVFEKNSKDFIARAITNEKGRYAFILDKGSYNLEVTTINKEEAKDKIRIKQRRIVAKDIKVKQL